MASSRGNPLARALVGLERLAARRLGSLLLFGLGLAVFSFRAIAWPLKAGRDLDEYLYAYIQLFDHDVLLPWSMLFRTPLTPVVAGLSLDVAGGAFVEPVVAVLFAASVLAWSRAALAFGPRVALVVAGALLVYPGYGAMFHELSSETVFAAVFSGWALLVTRAAFRPSAARFALVGVGVAALALVRPGNAVLLAFGVFPLCLAGPWRNRLHWAGAFALAAVIPLGAWTVHNGLRFDSYALARGGNAIIPFYRAFITDRIVAPENGEASQQLAAAMQRHLLTRDPYRSYNVTADELFRDGSFRVHEDLYLLSDQTFGWHTDYEILRKAGLEAVRAHPREYASGVLGTVRDELADAYFRPLPAQRTKANVRGEPTTVVGRTRLPPPTEGEPIPSGQVVWISRPDQSIQQVWTSGTDWHFAFDNPGDRARLREIETERDDLFSALPDRRGNATLALRLDQLSRWFPRPWMWIVLGLAAMAIRRPRGSATLAAIALSALAVVVLNALGLFADLHFVLPVAPAFVLFGAGALLGMRRGALSAT